MKPFGLVEIEDGSEANTTIVGTSDFTVIVVDWDEADIDTDYAQEMLDTIESQYGSGYPRPDGLVLQAITRLTQIIKDSDEYDDEEELDEDDEEEDEGPDFDDKGDFVVTDEEAD